jgi:hypothetical protein
MGYWFVDTAGIGSIIVLSVGFSVLVAYVTMLRWIQTAPRDPVSLEVEGHAGESVVTEAGGGEA